MPKKKMATSVADGIIAAWFQVSSKGSQSASEEQKPARQESSRVTSVHERHGRREYPLARLQRVSEEDDALIHLHSAFLVHRELMHGARQIGQRLQRSVGRTKQPIRAAFSDTQRELVAESSLVVRTGDVRRRAPGKRPRRAANAVQQPPPLRGIDVLSHPRRTLPHDVAAVTHDAAPRDAGIHPARVTSVRAEHEEEAEGGGGEGERERGEPGDEERGEVEDGIVRDGLPVHEALHGAVPRAREGADGGDGGHFGEKAADDAEVSVPLRFPKSRVLLRCSSQSA